MYDSDRRHVDRSPNQSSLECSMIPDLIPIPPNPHLIRTSSPIGDEMALIELPLPSRSSCNNGNSSGIESEIRRMNKAVDFLQKKFRSTQLREYPVYDGSSSGSSTPVPTPRNMRKAIDKYSLLVHQVKERHPSDSRNINCNIEESHFEITTSESESRPESSKSSYSYRLEDARRASNMETSLGHFPSTETLLDDKQIREYKGKVKSLHFLNDESLLHSRKLIDRSTQCDTKKTKAHSSLSDTFSVPIPKFAYPEYARQSSVRDLFDQPLDVDNMKSKKHFEKASRNNLSGAGVRARLADRPITMRPRHLDPKQKNQPRSQSPTGAVIKLKPFISTTGQSGQISYSIHANTQQVLALLKQYFPGLHSLKREILLSNERCDVALRFIRVGKTILSEMDITYQELMRDYDSSAKTQEMERRLDKMEKTYDSLKRIIKTLDLCLSSSRPIKEVTLNGGIVHQLKMIHNAIAESFAI